VCHPNLVQKLEKNLFTSTHFCLSNLTMAGAMASLGDERHRQQSKEKNEAAKAYTVKSLSELGLHAVPSGTNFIFVPIPNYKGDFAKDMLDKNVLLRAGNSANEKWARISIGTLEEMQKFIPILKATYSN
jgi:histidinol-phosphate aminotransferase